MYLWRTSLSYSVPPHYCLINSLYRIVGTRFLVRSSLPLSFLALIFTSAPVDVSRAIWGPDGEARDALAFVLNECCVDDMFCVDMLNDHGIIANHTSHDSWRDTILMHLLKGMCVSTSSSSCKLIAQESPSTAHLSYTLCMLLSAYEDMQINAHNFVIFHHSRSLMSTF
jgi:hypothetical protein